MSNTPIEATETSGRQRLDGSSDFSNESGFWELRLYVAGQTKRSIAAIANLRQICDEHLCGRYRIDVIDLIVSPQLAKGDKIVAIPTLVRTLPAPIRQIIGDLSNTDRVLVGLDITAMKRMPKDQ